MTQSTLSQPNTACDAGLKLQRAIGVAGSQTNAVDMLMERNNIYYCDCRVLLSQMDPESVHMVVTSPPYYPALRDYAVEPTVWSTDPACDTCDHDWIDAETKVRLGRGQFCRFCSAWLGVLGLEPSPELYVEHLVQIFRQVWRVLRSDGTVWLNIADAHAGGGRGGNTTNRPGVPAGAKAKDLLLIPDMLALALRADRWYFRQRMVWDKPNPMPESVESRPTTSHEFIFLLAKSGTAQYWSHRSMAGVRSKPDPDYRYIDRANDDHEVCNEPENWREETYQPEEPKRFAGSDSDGAGWIDRRRTGAPSDPRIVRVRAYKLDTHGRGAELSRRWSRVNLWKGHDYYYDHVAIQEPARYAGDPRGARPDSRRGSDMKQISERTVTGPMRSKRSVWRVVTEAFKGAHFAAYPTKLVEPCIRAGSSHRACPVCSAPWHRSTVKTSYITRPTTGSADQKCKLKPGTSKGLERVGGHVAVNTTTSRWLPTCGCDGNDGSGRCLVLDPFMGSGTTAVVGQKLGRDFLGFEANPEYVEMAQKRIQEEAAQTLMLID